MSVVIHDRARAAIDVLEPWERDQLMEVVDAFAAGGARPPGALERDGVLWLLVSIDLRAALQPMEGSPGQFVLLDIARPRALRKLFPEEAGLSVEEGGVA